MGLEGLDVVFGLAAPAIDALVKERALHLAHFIRDGSFSRLTSVA
jgi:hypothetical protein